MNFPFFDETRLLNETTRRDAGGSFIELTDGITHYELAGEVGRLPVVMTHGFSVPYFVYDSPFDYLVKAGFRVLRYDLYGRGFSDRPVRKYDIGLFVRQLKDLLDALAISRAHLIGLSMGGPVTASFTDRYPEYVAKQVFIDPAGGRRISISGVLELTKIPILGELALAVFGNMSLTRSLASDLFSSAMVEMFQAKYQIQMQYRGFKRAILSTIRNRMFESFFDTYARVGKLRKPTLVLWGKNDATVPFKDSQLILKAMPHAKLHAFDECGHLPHVEKAAEVNLILSRFLNGD